MKKKVIKGWVSRSCATPGDVMMFDQWGELDCLFPVFRLKKQFGFVTPKKVKITIELED